MDPAEVSRRVEQVWNRIVDAGGDPDRIAIVAVTKGFDSSAVEAAASAGLVLIGENYAQEMLSKLTQLRPETRDVIQTHFIGRLQTNKVRQLSGAVDVWQSVDRLRLVNEIARRCRGAGVFLQLDVSGADPQGGCPLSDAPALFAEARQAGLDVKGCMAIGPQGTAPEIAAAFAEVTRFADGHSLEHRCMGMSADLEQAIKAGSTMVRIGTALFGARPKRVARSGAN